MEQLVDEELVRQIRRHYDEGIANGSQSVIHDWAHVLDVGQNAQKIVEREGGSLEERRIAFLAGLLHDYCRQPEFKLKEQGLKDEHEKQGAQVAREILCKHFSKEFVEEVAQAVLTHSFGISPNSERGEGKPESLPAIALKIADKSVQARKRVVWARAVFTGECSGGDSSDNEILAYCQKREKKLGEYLQSEEGKLLLKHFPEAREGFTFVKRFNAELEKEIALAEKDAAANEFLKVAGALGIMRLGQQAGAKGSTIDDFERQYAKELEKLAVPKRKELQEAYEFSKECLAV